MKSLFHVIVTFCIMETFKKKVTVQGLVCTLILFTGDLMFPLGCVCVCVCVCVCLWTADRRYFDPSLRSYCFQFPLQTPSENRAAWWDVSIAWKQAPITSRWKISCRFLSLDCLHHDLNILIQNILMNRAPGSGLISGESLLLSAQRLVRSTGMCQHPHHLNKNLKM